MRENITIYARKMLKVRFVCMLIVCCFFVQSTFYVSTSLSSYCIDENLVVEEGTDFEDQLTWGFAGNANPAIVVEQGNRFLRASVTGQTGSRHATKTFVEPFSDSKVRINFDWRPNTVTTPLNSSEVLFRDSANNPIFRLVKSGGANGAVRYGVGTTGTDLARTVIIDGMSTDNRWLNADISFDFNNGTVSFELYDRENIENRFQMTDLSLIDVNYLSNIASMVISGNRASGQNLAFTTDIDNVRIYSTQTPAPDRPQIKISSISTVYQTNHTVPQGTTELDVISLLPRNLDVLLENGGRRTIPITWDSIDYDRTKIGDYIFESEFNLQGIVAVANPDNVRATVIVSVAYGEPVPQIDGYVNQYFSSFGDQVPVVPANWGFTTSGATLSINNADVAGNMTPKLQFTITNQTGGRNATKIFDPSVGGDVILVKFDWFPGLLNARGGNPHENGGEIRIIGSNNRTIFTINNTRNSPLRYFVGTQTPRETGFVNPEVWFQVEIRINVLHSEVGLKLTCKADQVMYESVSPLDVVDFGGTVNVVTIAGIRTAGNNITWTTFLDDFGIYNIPVPNNRIMSINRLPYHRVYVGETSEDISLLGLPSKVSATLADGSIAYVPVKTWLSKEGDWNPNIRGVYTFTGSIDSTPEFDNVFKRTATLHVYNRYPAPNIQRQVEWLNRGAIALTSDEGIFISWRLRADEFKENIKFDLLRNGNRINSEPLSATNFLDRDGKAGDVYKILAIDDGTIKDRYTIKALDTNYMAIPLQRPEPGRNRIGEEFTYSANDSAVGDLDGDGQFEIILKWEPSNVIDPSQEGLTGPTIFDAIRLDGTLLWRMNMGFNLTSGPHYHQFLVYDFDCDGKAELFIKTADGTRVYGVTDGRVDYNKIVSQIGNREHDGMFIGDHGKVTHGPEYISIFNGLTGEVIDTVNYEFPVDSNPGAWGDTWFNRSDRFLAAVAYLDGTTPSAVFGRGIYERTTFVAYDLVDGELITRWVFDSDVAGIQYEGLGNHSLHVGDVDNDGRDEILAGSLTIDDDGSVLYAMDGLMNRDRGAHGDAMHVGAFDPDREGLQVFGIHEGVGHASMQYRCASTGETIIAIHAHRDVGRGVAANITSSPGVEFWGTGDFADVTRGSGIYNVRGQIEHDNWRAAGLSVNFAIYWDGDLLRELLDDINIIKFNENTGVAEPLISFYGTVSNNGTKATPTLQADILGDWREEVLLRTPDSSELRLFSTTIPTDYRIYTLMHDHLYRMSVAWQNVAYNQPPHLGFYLGEDIRQQVLAGDIRVPLISLIVPELPVLPPVVPEAIVNDDFQNYEPGILMRLTDLSPKLWQGYELVINPGGTGNAQFEINRDPLTGNQSILLRDDYATPAGWLELRRTFPEITSGIVTVDIGFMQPVTATVARPLRIVDSAGNEVARLDTRAGPAISVRNHDGTVFTEMGRYSANEWVRIRLIIDLNNRIFNAFFNGRRVGEFPFNSAAATGIARIESRTPGSAVRSHFIDNVFVAPYKKIEAPVNFNAVAGDRQVNFTWDAVWGASTYTLKKGLESGGPYQIVATGVRDTSYLLTGLTNDVAYYFVVKAVTEDKMESALSLEVRAVPSTVPATPENITYTLDFATVSLSWDAVPTADSYVIRYGIQKELLEHSLEVHTNKHVFDDLEPGQIYFFTVSAKNEIGEGSPSQPLAIRAGDAKIYQAEYSVFPGSGIESIADRNFTGSGYVNMSSIVGSYIEWTVGMDAAGLQTLRLYYSLGRTDQTRPMSVSVNGMVIRDRVEFEPTFAGVFPSWGVWNTVEIKDVMLNEGPNKIRFTVLEFDGPNIDKLTVTGQPGLEYRVLSVESLGLGRVEVSPAGAVFPCTYVKGTIVTLNAATGNLFKFSHWSGDLTGSQSPADVTLDRNLAIQAHFLPDLEHVERAPGFAGLGIGTFGGFGGEVVTVTNKEELRNAIRDNVSRIIQVSGSIDLGQGAWIPVGSFKTILGLGDDAELLGGGLLLTGSTQVIIRNLRLGNAITPGYDPVAGVDAEFDALQINNSTHVWVDQCTFKNDAEIWVNNETSFDGLLDLINGSSYITISNSIFENHNQTMLIGNSDTLLSDRGRFRITLFNNWFRGTTTRHPRVRFGQVHVFNNYFDAVGYGIGVGVEASIISESNYFKNTAEPWRYLDSAAQPGFIRSEGDLFRESALIPEREEGVTWNPAEKYGHVLKAPESARAHTRVRAGAGRAGKVIRIDNESVTTGIRTHEITGTAAEKTILRVYNNAVLVLTREIDAYYDFRIPVYLNPGKNSFEIKADGDVVRFTVILEIPPVDIPEQPPVQPLAPVVPVTPVSVAEQPVIEGQRTVVELEGIIEIVAEAGAIEGDEAKLRAEIIPKDEASRILENAVAAEIVSVGQIVVLTLTGGEFTGRVNLTFGFDAARIPTGQMPSVFVYNERTGRWIYLGGRVVNGKISVSVSTFSKFGVFAANPLPPLTDIDNHWAQRSIMTMAGMDIVEGYPDGKFKPNAVITRAEFAAMLIRALGVEGKPEGALRFKDAADFDWAKGAIGALAELGIVFGIEDRRFAGGNKMTRAEAAVMLERVIAKGLIRIEYRESKAFADEKLFPQWAKSGIRAAKGFGLIRGFADGTFGYERSITRAEVATILYRLVAES